MNLASQLTALKKQGRDLTLVERAELSCRLAKQLEKAGEYEAACEALSEFWPERDKSLKLEGLDQSTKAEVLLRVGALAGWLGSAHQAEGSQETAKNLITRTIEIFETLRQTERIAEARADLALCYRREGSFDEARIHLTDALTYLKNEDTDLRAGVLIRLANVELDARRLNEAFRLYNEAAPLVEQSKDHSLKGAFHNQLALLYRNLCTSERRVEYTDRALIEFAAASYHFEEAGHVRYRARVENNLGELFSTIDKFVDADTHLDRARHLFLELRDQGSVAQVDETRARVLLAEGRFKDAERTVRSSVKTLEKGGEQALLAEALTTHGLALARLKNHSRARALLERAAETAQTTGDLEGAGRAQLSIIEELGEQTSAQELASIYQSAADLLNQSQDPSTNKRLISCACKVIDALVAAERAESAKAKLDSWEGFSFRQEITKIERTLVERALRDAGGSVSKAARLLGFKHHQSLIALLNSRHSDLRDKRSIVRRRRHHLFSRARRAKRKIVKETPKRQPSQISILHVEDNQQIANVVHDMLCDEWRVELSADGDTALRKLTGNDHYDLVVVDYDLPGLNGLELAQRARKITHRRRTPIVMLSANDCETDAWAAGVDAFLKKPEEIKDLPSTIARLLDDRSSHA